MNPIRPTRNSSIESTVLPDGHVVLTGKSVDWAFTLTPLGGLVWAFCDGQNSAEDIATNLLSLQEVNRESISSEEIASLLKELEDAGLLES
jgi:hypothetical protein